MTDLQLTGMQVISCIVALAMFILLFILLRRMYFKASAKKFETQGEHSQFNNVLTKKYNEFNAFRDTKPVWLFGLSSAMLMTLFAFSWTQYDAVVLIPDGALDTMEDMEIIPPQTFVKPPPPPPPPPPIIEEVPEEEILEDEEPIFESMDVDEETIIDEPEPVVDDTPVAPPPPPPPAPEVEDEILNFAEQMPRFAGCEEIDGDKRTKDKCAEEKMLKYIYKNVNYPAIARENGIEGMVYIQFVVDKKGKVTKANIVRGIGGGCGEEALQVIEGMPDWTPGKQGGRPVKVLYTLPVKFQLN